MKYEFKCKNCGKTKVIDVPMSEISGIKIICDCGTPMRRVWKASLIVPDYMKAEQTQEMAYVNDRLNIRPSGKTKIYY